MEVQNISSSSTMSCNKEEGEDDDVPLPGFRFHPTEEELVGFYLKRKVEKRPLSIELIKQADIYKYDPWDLPKTSNVGEKEWFFFCQRGRKYRNSIRPNRVTGSGFWKATGIDRPVYQSSSGCIIGLKKSLVYYRGSAGKGTKTDWMMHEFRLPAPHDKSAKHFDSKALVAQEPEVWTLCRIFKKSVTYKKSVSDWKSEAGSKRTSAADYSTTSKTCSSNSNSNNSSSITSSDHNKAGLRQNLGSSYISFGKNVAPSSSSSSMPPPHQFIINTATAQMVHGYCTKPYSHPQILANFHNHNNTPAAHSMMLQSLSISSQPQASFAVDATAATPSASSVTGSVCEFLRHGADWEDLRSVVLDSAATVDSGNYNPLYS